VGGGRHVWQGGHKALQRLGNAPADLNPAGSQSAQNRGRGLRVGQIVHDDALTCVQPRPLLVLELLRESDSVE
jgi:hypothetical protein